MMDHCWHPSCFEPSVLAGREGGAYTIIFIIYNIYTSICVSYMIYIRVFINVCVLALVVHKYPIMQGRQASR